MRKIDKTLTDILSVKYKKWLEKQAKEGKNHDKTNRYYYDDIVMNLYKCQFGVCAYTEMFICIPVLYNLANWVKGRYKIPNEVEYSRLDHFGEMDHFDATDKELHY